MTSAVRPRNLQFLEVYYTLAVSSFVDARAHGLRGTMWERIVRFRSIEANRLYKRIVIADANLRNIDQFEDEPSEAIVAEIKQHVKDTSDPCSWWGHSHTAPPANAFVVYLDDFDIPAPKGILAVAPCPCCSPQHAKYKSGGKIAWFPNERVIRLIGPICFNAINAVGHEEALIDLKRRKKLRREIEIISDYAPRINLMLDVMEAAIPIARDLDAFMLALNKYFDDSLNVRVVSHIMEGVLSVSKTVELPFIKPDGSIGSKKAEVREAFGRLEGHSMLDRSGKLIAAKLEVICVGLKAIASKLAEIGNVADLLEKDRERFSVKLPECRFVIAEALNELKQRQRFLTSRDIQTLHEWGCHPDAPISLEAVRKRDQFQLKLRPRRGAEMHKSIMIGANATRHLPSLSSFA